MAGKGAQNETIARSLMGAVGQACKVTGLALSATSTLYFTHALTAGGVAVIEYLPALAAKAAVVAAGAVIAAPAAPAFSTHMADRAVLGWGPACWLGVCLLTGILLRKTGTGLSDERVIARAETFLYGTRPDASAARTD
jgi:hypothetical protein